MRSAPWAVAEGDRRGQRRAASPPISDSGVPPSSPDEVVDRAVTITSPVPTRRLDDESEPESGAA
jgi:hypothetical protein